MEEFTEKGERVGKCDQAGSWITLLAGMKVF